MGTMNFERILLKCLPKIVKDNMSDELYLKLRYKASMGKKLNLENPKTFNEKLQWLKLYDRKSIYTTMVDKYEAKKYVAERIGEDYIIPTIGVWDSFDEIDFDKLPNQFVLKCTHDSGGLVICRDKNSFDINKAKKNFEKSLKCNYYLRHREWPYKNVKPRIIAEQYMEESSNDDLLDYKLMCFDGEVKCSFLCSDRNSSDGLKVTFYDREWTKLPFERHYPSAKECEKPKCYDEMIALAEKLSEKLPFLRVDFYQVDNKVYFGELTFYPGAGFEEFTPKEWDTTFGSWIKLPENSGGGYALITDGVVLWFHEKKEQHHEVKGLTDYKFYCFNGEPKYLYVSKGLENHETAQISFLDVNWSFADFNRSDYKPFDEIPEKPQHYENMLEIARRLSEGIPFVRVDLYEIRNQIYFGELTFHPCAGMMPFNPEEWDYTLGEWIKLPPLI